MSPCQPVGERLFCFRQMLVRFYGGYLGHSEPETPGEKKTAFVDGSSGAHRTRVQNSGSVSKKRRYHLDFYVENM